MLNIIITSYNRPLKLKKLLDSVFSQTFQKFKIIIADDNSCLDTEKITHLYDSNKIVYFKNDKNMGYANNCKQALKYCNEKYIIFLSDDDILIDQTFLEKAFDMFNKNNVDTVFGRIGIRKGKYFIVNKYPFKEIYEQKEFLEEIVKLRFSFLDYFSFSSFIFKLETFKLIKPFETIFPRAGSVDISSIIKYVFLSKKIGFIDVVAYEWVKSCETSLSGEKKDDLVYQTLQTVSAGIDIYNFFENKEICKKICNEYIKYSFNAILSDYEQLNNAKHFNNLLNQLQKNNINKVYIYCRGWVGLELKDFLGNNGIEVLKFIDDYKKDYDDTIDFQCFSKIMEKKNVIIASYKYKDIYLIFKNLTKLENIMIFDLVD